MRYNKHRCNLSAHVLSLIQGKWRILRELCRFGFQEDKRCLFLSRNAYLLKVPCFYALKYTQCGRELTSCLM